MKEGMASSSRSDHDFGLYKVNGSGYGGRKKLRRNRYFHLEKEPPAMTALKKRDAPLSLFRQLVFAMRAGVYLYHFRRYLQDPAGQRHT